MRLQGKVVLITGAARRVGRAIATTLAQRGARLAIHYNSSRTEAQRLADELHEDYGREPLLLRADLSDARAAAKLADAAAKHFGAIHVLINNASLYEKSNFGSTSIKEWDDHLDVNLRAPFFLSQAVAPHMQKGGEGKIINIADWAALRPYADYIPYCVSKAGLLCLNTVLAKKLAPEIQVNAVMPGPVLLPEAYGPKQRKAVQQATLLKRLGSPDDVAKAVLYLIESADFVTGAAIPVDGGRLIA
jgi:pteridine reductase